MHAPHGRIRRCTTWTSTRLRRTTAPRMKGCREARYASRRARTDSNTSITDSVDTPETDRSKTILESMPKRAPAPRERSSHRWWEHWATNVLCTASNGKWTRWTLTLIRNQFSCDYDSDFIVSINFRKELLISRVLPTLMRWGLLSITVDLIETQVLNLFANLNLNLLIYKALYCGI